MKLILNGEEITSYCSTLEDFCLEGDYISNSIATAINGIFVPRDLRPNTVLEDGDNIEIVVPLQGG